MAIAYDKDSATKVQAILSSRDDWRAWFQVIKDHANEQEVWEYFDPDADDETRPEPPTKPKIPSANEASENAYRYYQMMLQEWKDTRNAIQSTNKAIRSSVALQIRELIADKETYKMLQILKQQYAPSDQEADFEALKNYNTVRSRSIRQGKISAWLNDFDNAYLAIKRRNLPESNDKHVKRQFLAAISPVSYSFADRQAEMMNDPMYEKEDFHALLERYRTYLANTEGFKTTASGMAFATFHGQSNDPTTSPKPNNNGHRSSCICGKNHPYSNCWYIIRSKRPKQWKPNKEIEAKISEAIAKDDKIGRKIKALMEPDEQQNRTDDQKESNKLEEHHVMTLVSSAEIGSSLKNCFILDSGASIHVCNNISRFENYDPSATRILYAGDTTMRIQGTGNVKIRPNCGGESGNIIITLTNVAYVPGIHTNIIGARRLEQAGYSRDIS
jgi:hypothetical protein